MNSVRALAAAALVTLAAPCLPASADTIAEIVAADTSGFDGNRKDYDILLTALQTADLVDALNDPDSNLTVFAPNDLAFIRLARDLGYSGNDESDAWDFLVVTLTSLGDGDPIPVLTNILLYHVVGTRISIVEFLALSFEGEEVETLLEGATFRPGFFRIIDNDPDIRNPALVRPLRINADNGIIHTINRVLLPIDLD